MKFTLYPIMISSLVITACGRVPSGKQMPNGGLNNISVPLRTPAPLSSPTSTPLPTATPFFPTPNPIETSQPTAVPTPVPISTPAPTATPTVEPTRTPTIVATSVSTSVPTPVPTAVPVTYRAIDIRMGVTSGYCLRYGGENYYWQWNVSSNKGMNAYRLAEALGDSTLGINYVADTCYQPELGCLGSVTFGNFTSSVRRAGVRILVPLKSDTILYFKGAVSYKGQYLYLGGSPNGFAVQLGEILYRGKIQVPVGDGQFTFEIAEAYNSISEYSTCPN